MTPERWQRVKEVVGRAIELPAGTARDTLVDMECADDDELRTEVQSLVAAAEMADSLPGVRDAVAAEARAMNAYRDGGERADPELQAVLEAALGRQYDIMLPLGRGGMGAVYLARDRALERFVAIKVLRPDLAAAPGGRERFRREARIAAQLAHPGILPLHSFGEVDGIWYFVMGYVRGESLASRLAREGAVPAAEARRILAELADALDSAHRHGVVHRDIKPANILLEADGGRAVLADFGIARLLGADDGLTASGAVMGTPHYMSPEQASGTVELDARSDIYSLGAVAYTMIAGREPFVGESAADLTYQRLVGTPPPLRTLVPTVPPLLESIIMRCLEREPALRWPDARTLREALGQVDDAAATLPESVRGLPGFGPYAMIWAAGWILLASRAPAASADRALLLLIAVIVPVGLGLHVWNTGRNGLSPLQLARVACWPPEWWGMWWPRVLRRPGDLWARLPRPARGMRLVLSAFIVLMPALILAPRIDAFEAFEGIDVTVGEGGFALAKGVLFAAAVLAVLGALAWTRWLGLSVGEAVHLLFGATVPSAAWRAPRLAALVESAIVGVRPPDTDSASDLSRAISEVAPLLPDSAAPAGQLATRLVQRMTSVIAQLDRQCAMLVRDASDAERDRLAARLAALEDPAHPDLEERTALRALVAEQLAVVRRMKGRHEVACRERAQWMDQLRALWQQLRHTYQAAAAGPAELTSATARLATHCAEVEEKLARMPSALVSMPASTPGASAGVPSYSPITGPR